MVGVPDVFLITYGVELASSWVNMMLYMLEIAMCVRYFQRANRPLAHKIGVGLMLVFDTVCTMSVDANVLITFLGFFGKETFMALSVPTTVTILMTYSTAAVEQLFLCQLFYILSRKRIISICLLFLNLVHLSLSYAAGIMVQTEAFTQIHLTFQITAAGAIICGINDLLIASFLGYEFYKITNGHSSSRQVWRRVFVLCLTSGAIVASTTLLMMILLLKGDIAFDFFFSCQGRVYALTLLVNFLSGPFSSSSGSSTGGPSGQEVYRPDPYLANFTDLDAKRSMSGRSHRSNISEESLNKELPALPRPSTTEGSFSFPKALTATAASPQFALISSPLSIYLPSSSESRVAALASPPVTPRTIISAPRRFSSLPSSSREIA